jgi:hypothetical protein
MNERGLVPADFADLIPLMIAVSAGERRCFYLVAQITQTGFCFRVLICVICAPNKTFTY